jgi:hypothetical protein
MRLSTRATVVLIGVMLAATLTGCATTVIEEPTAADVTTTTVAVLDIESASLRELGGVLAERVDALSAATFAGDKTLARSVLADIDTVWTALSDGIRAELPMLADQLLYDFERVIALCRTSVERNRPADADKALRFLPLALASLPG